MPSFRQIVFVLSWLLILPASVEAQQSTLSGVVKDSSSAVLPGVTIEASSPVLIEKTRTAVTDGTGQYRLPELPPGTYTVTFTLPGFSTVKREGVEVSGVGVTTINAELRVGAISETITVTGETPVVDIQTSTKKQVVLSGGVVESLPASRGYGNVLSFRRCASSTATAVEGMKAESRWMASTSGPRSTAAACPGSSWTRRMRRN